MAGLGIKLFTDEDVDPDLAEALRRRGYDAVCCLQAGRSNLRISDHDQLTYAAQQGRAILVFNVVDYVRLDRRWKAASQQHAGIVVSPKIDDVGELLRRVMCHLDIVSPDQQGDALLWLLP